MCTANTSRRGQAIVLITLALFAMCGLMGLAVDLGWSFYVRKSAQAAADAAAIAAAQAGMERLGVPPHTCGNSAATLNCTDSDPNDSASAEPVNCDQISNTSNLYAACVYAGANGFLQNGRGGRQSVSVAADVTSPAPTRPGVDVEYWVTVRVTERVPQLFSAVFGKTDALVSARATAAIADSLLEGALILTNREGDCVPVGTVQRVNQPNAPAGMTCGLNVLVQPSGNIEAINAKAGIRLASGCAGENCGGVYAGMQQGNAEVVADWTYMRRPGAINPAVSDDPSSEGWWSKPPTPKPDSKDFYDPMHGKTQPSIPSGGLPSCGIPGGVLGGPTGTSFYPPANYYATDARTGRATGAQLIIAGDVHFTSTVTGTCGGGSPSNSDFGTAIFWGGLTLGANAATITFDPGRFVFAGSMPKSTANGRTVTATPLFDIKQGQVVLQSSVPNPDADYGGQLFIFTAPGKASTDPLVNALDQQLRSLPAGVPEILAGLKHGQAGFHTGGSAKVDVKVHGLSTSTSSVVPSELLTQKYGNIAMWSDRRNTRVKYDAKGNVLCGNNASSCAKTDDEATADRVLNDSPLFYWHAGSASTLKGIIYQPRGSVTEVGGGADYTGALRIITGAINVTGSGNVFLQPTTSQLTSLGVNLIE